MFAKDDPKEHRRIHRAPFLLLLALLLVLPAEAFHLVPQSSNLAAAGIIEWTDGFYHLFGAPEGILDGPVTVRTVFHFEDASPVDHLAGVWLAGLSSQPKTIPSVLTLAWVQQPSLLLPNWRLQLQSSAGLLPLDQPNQPGKGTWAGSGIADIDRTRPIPGHSYESVLSYDPVSGAISVALTDVTTLELVYAGAFQSGCYSGRLFPGAGIVFKGESNANLPSITLADFEAYRQYSPVGTTWLVESRALGQPNYRTVNLIEDQDEAGVRLRIPGLPPSGQYRLLANSAGSRQELARFAPTAPEHWFSLPVADLLPGRSTLVLEYLEEGNVLLADFRDIWVGSVSLRFSPLTVNRAERVLQGELRVLGGSDVPGLGIEVYADTTRLKWDGIGRIYREEPYESRLLFTGALDVMGGGETALALELELPEERGTWRTAFRAELEETLLPEVSDRTRLFSTYEPADVGPGNPFTIGVLPDTQYYAEDYPEILVRQAEWLAENAAEDSIALMLHLGDITNLNTPLQWERAQHALGLLDGVVPYVLAVGNHDMLLHGELDSRENTLVDSYFPAERFASLGGTYQPNRISNSYYTFNIGDMPVLVMALEFRPRDEVLQWADRVLSAHAGYRAILMTHTYTSRNGSRTSSANSTIGWQLVQSTSANDGEGIWNKLLHKHDNVILVLSGHIGSPTIPRQTAIGDKGNRVHELLIDYQWEPNGGEGWLALLEFTPERGILVRVYSPYLGRDQMDRDAWGFSNHFALPLD